MKHLKYLVLLIVLIAAACGGDDSGQKAGTPQDDENKRLAERFGLTVFELENGIGPIKEKLNLTDQIDEIKAQTGKNIFEEKCSQCHKLDERYTGPALGNVTSLRTPEYIVNMILNPEEMTRRHPEAKKMLATYANQMTFQNVSHDDALALLEYLRSVNK